jgi:hypothetical protein
MQFGEEFGEVSQSETMPWVITRWLNRFWKPGRGQNKSIWNLVMKLIELRLFRCLSTRGSQTKFVDQDCRFICLIGSWQDYPNPFSWQRL